MERPGLTHNRRAGVVARRSEEHAPEFVAPGFKTPERGVEETRWRWVAVLVLLLTALLYFVRLGDRALWASEFRWGEVAREMLLTDDFFWPTINGRVYFDKPLGSYWLIIATAWLSGHLNEASTRIPCALSGLLAAGLMILLGRRLYDLRTGVASGLILATCFSFVFWARTASADVETVAGELAALLIFKNNQQRTGWWVVPLWLMMALTSLMKGLLGFVLPLLVIGVYSLFADGWYQFKSGVLSGSLAARLRWLIGRNRWFFQWRTVVAVALAVVIYGAPFVISHDRTGSARGIYMVYRENIQRYFAPFDHRGPIYLYVYVIFGLMAPWSLFLPAALVHAHLVIESEPDEHSAHSDRFALAFFWTTFVFFTLSGSRRSYYILPILPAGAIMIARLFLSPDKQMIRLTKILLKVGAALFAAVLLFSIVCVLPPAMLLPKPWSSLPPAPYRLVFAACWIISMLALGYAFIPAGLFARNIAGPDDASRVAPLRFAARWLNRTTSPRRPLLTYAPTQMLLVVGAITYLLMFYVFVFAMPAGDRWRPEKPFAQDVRQLVDGRSAELAAFKTTPPVFYLALSRPVPQYANVAQLASDVRTGRIRWIILRRRDLPSVVVPAHIAASEAIYPWDPPEHQRNALVLLESTQNR
jgi:4-amino-4-deoxy-L-arabinose transferase-like glycosyltransferase